MWRLDDVIGIALLGLFALVLIAIFAEIVIKAFLKKVKAFSIKRKLDKLFK